MSPFLGAPLNEGLSAGALPDVSKAYSFWTVKLMTTAGSKVHLDRFEVQGQMRHGLNRVTVQIALRRFAQGRQSLQIAKIADFIVGMHEGNHARLTGRLLGFELSF